MRAPLPLGSLIQERVSRLMAEGLNIHYERAAGLDPVVLGDPIAFGLMLDLIFDSFLEDRSRVRQLEIRLDSSAGLAQCVISEDSGLLPCGLDHRDLGLLLRDTRHGRALGSGLCVRLVEDGMGGFVELGSSGGLDSHLRMEIPTDASISNESDGRQLP
jgi:hypothetical protein